jgi:hypothetical protein
MKKKRLTPAEALAKRLATLTNYVNASWPGASFELDDEARAAYWVGPFRRWPKKDPVTLEEKYEIDLRDALQLALDHYPETGNRHRMLGEIKDRILYTTRAKKNGATLHWHPRLNCYTVARWPILHASRFGFHAIEINGHSPVPVNYLLQQPEVPPKERGGYERQIQILGVAQSGEWKGGESVPSV